MNTFTTLPDASVMVVVVGGGGGGDSGLIWGGIQPMHNSDLISQRPGGH